MSIPDLEEVMAHIKGSIAKPSKRDKQVKSQYLTEDNRANVAKRYWKKVQISGPDECWEWTGAKVSAGYGNIAVDKRSVQAHRVGYELSTGMAIPSDMTVDHLCYNKACQNPKHFEIVTRSENSRRRWVRYRTEVKPFITHCPHGHELTPENTYITPNRGSKRCKLCIRVAGRKHDAKRGWRR